MMRKSLLSLGVIAALFAAGPAAATDAATEKRIAALEAQVRALQAELQTLKGQPPEAAAPAATPPATEAASVEAESEALAANPEEQGAPTAPPAPASAEAEANALAANPAEAATSAVAAPTGETSGGSNPNAFNPAISIILNGSYSHHSLDPDSYVRAGFPLAGEAGPGADGFSLGESEVSFAANIDDKFYGQLTASIDSEDGEDHLGIEEAYIDTTALPAGFSLRMGRFFSNIGYLNSHHAHTDNFFDRPLPYQAFLGGQYGDDGVQLRWVAPTSVFLEFGGELLRGQNYPSGGAQDGGVGTRTLFAHVGGDAGTNNEWLAGVSMLKTRTENGEDGFSGDATVYVADGTWKWAPDGNFKDGGITLRSEYFVDDRDGTYLDPLDPNFTALWNGSRHGAYLEGVYRFNRTWDLGYRYDRLWGNADLPFATGFDPYRHSAELTWRNSEFSLVRLQLSHDKPNPDDSDNVVTLQYQTSLGAHGAHKF